VRAFSALFFVVLAGCDPCDDVKCSACQTCRDGFCKNPRVELAAAIADEELEPDAGLYVPVDPSPATEAGLGWQPIRIEASRTSHLVLDAAEPGGVEVATADGTVLPFPAPLDAEDLRVRGTASGDSALFVQCTGEELTLENAIASLPLRVQPFPGLVATELGGFPWLDFARTSNAGAPLAIGLDPARHAERVGLPFDAYVAAHRSAAEWSADPAIEDVTGTVESALVPAASGEGVVQVWDAADAGDYDVVLDFGADGRLDPGDFVSTVSVLTDPAAPGPMATATYDYDRPTFTLPVGFDGLITTYDVHVRGRVVHPDPVPDGAPLVVFLHGNHPPLYLPDPYPTGAPRRVDADLTSDENYRGFTYLQTLLASWGYVTMSLSLDDAALAEYDGVFGGSFPTPNSTGIRMRAWTALKNVEAIFGDAEVAGPTSGKIDPGNIHIVGHSRGGEAALQVFHELADETERPEVTRGSPERLAGEESWTIRSVASFSPVSFIVDTPPLGDVPFLLVYGKADGDVDGYTNEVRPFQFYDLADGDKQAIVIEGANHNAFNTSWPCSDAEAFYAGTEFSGGCAPFDPTGENLIDGETQREIAKAYLHAFLLTAAEGDGRYADYFRRPADRFRPPGVAPAVPIHGQYRPSVAADRIALVVDDFESETDPLVSSSGEDVVATGAALEETALSDTYGTATRFAQRTRGAIVGWTGEGALFEETVAEDSRDFTVLRAISVRVAQEPMVANTTDLDADLSVTVTLLDLDGQASRIQSDVLMQIPDVYPSTGYDYFTFERFASTVAVFKTVRIDPLAFVADGAAIDLTRIAKIRIELEPSIPGQIGLDDVDLIPE
jgi:hypothetical protein